MRQILLRGRKKKKHDFVKKKIQGFNSTFKSIINVNGIYKFTSYLRENAECLI